MQFFGIGIPELLLVLTLTVIVVGPERLPEVAAQLARWIRQARAYAQYVSRDFNEVISELEKETGASREDFKEIAGVLRRDTASVFQELDKASKEVQEATDLEKAAGSRFLSFDNPAPNGASNGAVDSTALKEPSMQAEAASEDGSQAAPPPAAEPAKDEEWFVPTPSRRRRRADDA